MLMVKGVSSNNCSIQHIRGLMRGKSVSLVRYRLTDFAQYTMHSVTEKTKTQKSKPIKGLPYKSVSY